MIESMLKVAHVSDRLNLSSQSLVRFETQSSAHPHSEIMQSCSNIPHYTHLFIAVAHPPQ